MNRVYSPDNRINALNLYAAGVPVNEIMWQTGFSHSYLYALIKKANLPRQRVTKTNLMDSASSEQVDTIELVRKKKLVDGFRASKNKTRYATEHGISRSTLCLQKSSMLIWLQYTPPMQPSSLSSPSNIT